MDISVITPVYNGAKYLNECIESVLCQDGISLEHIIIDDGSTDSTRDIALSYPRIKYLHQKNLGANVARNNGIKVANGKYIKLLDADDCLVNGSLLKQLKTSEKFNEKCIGYGYHKSISDADGTEKVCPARISRLNSIEQLILTNVLTSLPLYPRSALQIISGFNETLHARQEWDLNLRLVGAGYEFVYDQVLTFKQRYHDSPERISNRRLNVAKELAALATIYENLPEPKTESVNDAWSAYLWGMGRQFIYQGDKAAAEIVFMKAKMYSKKRFLKYLGWKFRLARFFMGDTLPDTVGRILKGSRI